MAPAQRRLSTVLHADALAMQALASSTGQLAHNQVHGGRLRMRPMPG